MRNIFVLLDIIFSGQNLNKPDPARGHFENLICKFNNKKYVGFGIIYLF